MCKIISRDGNWLLQRLALVRLRLARLLSPRVAVFLARIKPISQRPQHSARSVLILPTRRVDLALSASPTIHQALQVLSEPSASSRNHSHNNSKHQRSGAMHLVQRSSSNPSQVRADCLGARMLQHSGSLLEHSVSLVVFFRL